MIGEMDIQQGDEMDEGWIEIWMVDGKVDGEMEGDGDEWRVDTEINGEIIKRWKDG